MKKLEFETSKGEFMLVGISKSIEEAYEDGYIFYKLIGKLSDITEEQASEMVDIWFESDEGKVFYTNYLVNGHAFESATESLQSLIKSKGVHLFENPYKNMLSIQSLEGSQIHSKNVEEAEEKTIYNPYLFKKI